MKYTKLRNGILAILLSSNGVNAENIFEQQAKQSITIPFADQTIVVDGNLDEALWKNAKVIQLDTITSPFENTPSPIKTEARIIDNGEFLLLAFKAYDPDPTKIVASLGERDTKWYDDSVGIKLDPLNNRRVSYSFFVNAYGVQSDETFNEVTGEANDLWDGIWHSFGKITEDGYQVEIAIPYSILNFDQGVEQKSWPFELVRIYPREQITRISNISIDRNNPCYLCQYPMAQGFEQAKIGKSLQLTPSLVGIYDQKRDIYDDNADWDSDLDVEPSLDVKWNISPNTVLNATINPDFSTVEADSAQLSVNTKFSLFYDEKRSFFLENNSYFDSPVNLVYTRNIADPDYGLKLTGAEGKHSYGMFVSHDTETNFIQSGNLSATIGSVDSDSHSGAVRYLYDLSTDTTLGFISTFREADDYHNYVVGVDARHKFTESDAVSVQFLSSDSKYPTLGAADGESDNSIDDMGYHLEYKHSSEFWSVTARRQAFAEDFRADLGFVNRTDYIKDTLALRRNFYPTGEEVLFPQVYVNGIFETQHNYDGEFISRQATAFVSANGPMLSYLEFNIIDADKVGLRIDPSNSAIDNNTERFNEQQFVFYGEFRPSNITYLSLQGTIGDQIDYDNNRLGDTIETTANFTWNPTPHAELDLYHTYSKLDADGDNVFIANLTDLRLRYYFNVHSAIKLSVVYQDIDYNKDNNPLSFYSEKDNSLSTKLVYSYKLNPQTVFFLGYSDSSFQDDYIGSLKQSQRTIFTKLSYAWR